MRFRQGVYANRGNISAGCQVLLLRLSDDMNERCIVSVPRSRLAKELCCPPARITEWMQQAKELGFLDTVRRGRPGVTATYAGLFVERLVRPAVPPEVRPAVPSQDDSAWYGNPDHAGVRPAVPQSVPAWYAQHPSQEVVRTAAIGTHTLDHLEQRGHDEEPGSHTGSSLDERSA